MTLIELSDEEKGTRLEASEKAFNENEGISEEDMDRFFDELI